MKAEVLPGKYVLAVSGGVDSMALLDLLAKMANVELIVAHFNHGIRPDSDKDEELVRAVSKRLKLRFEVGYGHLGAGVSEDTARKARYAFFGEVLTKHQADNIITAHHQDDLIETAILNLIRGTGRRGIVSISENKAIIRPLLTYSKQEILSYAKKNKLKWREDSTNQDDKYLRNYIRKNIMANLTNAQCQSLRSYIDKVAKIEKSLNPEIAKISLSIFNNQEVNRASFAKLPVNLGNELIMYWLRKLDAVDIDKRTVNRINLTIRTAKPGSLHPVKSNLRLNIRQKTAEFSSSI